MTFVIGWLWISLEQKPKEIRDQIWWLSGEKALHLARDRVMLAMFEKSQGQNGSKEMK